MLINVVQPAERVYVIVYMRREINLCLHDSKLAKKVTLITRLSRNQNRIKGVFFLDVF